MITEKSLTARGWKLYEANELRLEHDGFTFYFLFMEGGRCAFGVLEEADMTPMFEGKIENEDIMQQLFDLTIFYDDDVEREPFDLVGWLKARGWEGDDDECVLDTGDDLASVYTCTAMGDNDFIITLEDDFTDDIPDYLYNGSVLNEEQAEMIMKALELPL